MLSGEVVKHFVVFVCAALPWVRDFAFAEAGLCCSFTVIFFVSSCLSCASSTRDIWPSSSRDPIRDLRKPRTSQWLIW